MKSLVLSFDESLIAPSVIIAETATDEDPEQEDLVLEAQQEARNKVQQEALVSIKSSTLRCDKCGKHIIKKYLNVHEGEISCSNCTWEFIERKRNGKRKVRR